MQSKTSSFNRTIFLNLFTRFWPVFVAYLGVWILTLPVAMSNNLELTDAAGRANVVAEQLLGIGYMGGTIISAIFGVFIAMAAFSYLYSPRSVSMACALPIKRENVFFTLLVSGFFWMLAANLIVFGVALGVEAFHGVLNLPYTLNWLFMVCLTNLYCYGFAAFCASLTGHILALPLVYVVLNFTVVVVESIVRAILSLFIFGSSIEPENLKLIFLSPLAHIVANTEVFINEYYIGNETILECSYNGWWTLGIYAAVGVLCALVGMALVRHRRMETAGDVVAVKPLKPVFKYCMSFGCALVLGVLVCGIVYGDRINGGFSGMLMLLVTMMLGAFIGYFGSEMLMQKTLRVFGAKWGGFVVVGLVITAFMLCGEFDVFGYERRVPEPDQVLSVEASYNGINVELERTESIEQTILLHKEIIAHKKQIESSDYYSGEFHIDYTMSDGSLWRREYSLSQEENGALSHVQELFNCPEAISDRKKLNLQITVDTIIGAEIRYRQSGAEELSILPLEPEEALELYENCILPDISSGGLGRVWIRSNSSYYEKVLDCKISISLAQRNKEGETISQDFDTTVTTDAALTLKWLSDRGIVPGSVDMENDMPVTTEQVGA